MRLVGHALFIFWHFYVMVVYGWSAILFTGFFHLLYVTFLSLFGGHKKCEHCAEDILKEAKVCRYCTRNVKVEAEEVSPKSTDDGWS
jgi:hypothetical protein